MMVTLNILAAIACGLFFGLMLWVLQNMGEFPLHLMLAFTLGIGAESLRQQIVKGTQDDGDL